MVIKIVRLGTISLILFWALISPVIVQASWSKTEETVLVGLWGSGKNEFGLLVREYSMFDEFPFAEYYLYDRLIIWDTVNGRMKVYLNDGSLNKIVKCIEDSNGAWNEECRIEGKFIAALSNDKFLTEDDSVCRYFTPSGTLVQTSSTRPLELGKITKERLGKTQWRYEIEFPDRIYIYEGGKDALKEQDIVRINENLIAQNSGAKVYAYKPIEELTPTETGKKRYRIDKVAEWSKPEDQGEPTTIDVNQLPPGIGPPRGKIIAEYGDPHIGPDGSIFIRMRSDTHYKILRWKWVE
jgi:hypothetical protein